MVADVKQHDPYDDLESQVEVDPELRRRAEALAAKNEAADFVWLMSSPKGRRFVRRLLEQAGVFRSSFHQNAMQMAFTEGGRGLGLRLLTLIHDNCPKSYQTMMQEHRDEFNRTVASDRSTANN